jgi:hypothetical protein
MGGASNMHVKYIRNAYKILVGKSENWSQINWMCSMDLLSTQSCGGLLWTRYFLVRWAAISFSRRNLLHAVNEFTFDLRRAVIWRKPTRPPVQGIQMLELALCGFVRNADISSRHCLAFQSYGRLSAEDSWDTTVNKHTVVFTFHMLYLFSNERSWLVSTAFRKVHVLLRYSCRMK